MKRILSFAIILTVSLILISQTASAQLLNKTEGLTTMTDTVAGTAGMGNVSVGYLAAKVIQVVLGLLAIIFLVLMIIAGFDWMTAAGNDEKVKKSTATIKTAIIGLIIVLGAYAITYFVFKYLPFAGGGTMGKAV